MLLADLDQNRLDDAAAVADAAIAHFGHGGMLVNNAGLMSFKPIEEQGIRVNAVLPGAADTPMLWDNPNVFSGAETINKADIGPPDDIDAAITFLAGPAAAFICDDAIRVEG